MKKFLKTIFITLLIFIPAYIYRDQIIKYTMSHINQQITIEAPQKNSYNKMYEFELVQPTDDFHVKNKNHILNVIYTILNSGQKEFEFYCDINYQDCEKDLKEISQDQTLLSTINNMISPYNSYEKLYITINNYGKAKIKIDPLYNDEEIKQINTKIDEITNNIINDDMTNEQKIKAFHDYLINNTTYDEERASLIEQGNSSSSTRNSHKASGPLLEGWALCSGYSDAMKLFLDRLNLPNYKISTTSHIWNFVYIDNAWKHIDLTWDDPVTNDHSNVLLHNFFLIDTNTLLSLDTTNHTFNETYYPEAKKS